MNPPTDLNPRTDPPLDFPDRDFGELKAADYDALGFMAGLEVHQQLFTKSKLFCRCPAGIRTTVVDAEVLRHMRPTLSELGEYDGTALMEFKTRKEIVYRLARTSVCTYELDDTPPFPIDEESVRIAIEASKLLGLNLVSELHVMRKQYLDGSIPTGFQRTAMIGLGGEIPLRRSELGPGRQLRIRQLSLEEDSCREVTDHGHQIVFRTDRLGMPLIETVTEPELLTPLDVQLGVKTLAAVARSTGKVRRGAGAARQDVNVSVAGGRRVEIKGVSSHRAVPVLVHNEAYRQLNLLRIKAELERRGVTADMLAVEGEGKPWDVSPLVVDARAVLRRSDYHPLRDGRSRGDMICAVRLPGFRHLLMHRTQPGMTFASEVAGRVQVIACLTARPFMIHSDIQGYGLKGSSWQQLRNATRADHGDALVVLWGAVDDVATAAREVLARAAEALIGVPSETRQSFADGTTGFERILPGPDRMYPDTDTPPVPVQDDWITEIEGRLPTPPWVREDAAMARGLTEAQAARLVDSPWEELFDALDPAEGAAARRLAAALEKRLVQYWREVGHRDLPDIDRLRPLVDALNADGPFVHAFEELMLRVLRDPQADPAALVARIAATDADSGMQRAVASVVSDRATVRTSSPDALLRWAVGRVMHELRGTVEPDDARARLTTALEIGGVV
jgi:glutamyl-tRNA(Gln) amidotransferase subunit E